MVEEIMEQAPETASAVPHYLSLLRSDGSFRDLNYRGNSDKSAADLQQHGVRLEVLSLAYKWNDAGNLLSGDKPTKEAFLHLAMYQERPSASSIVHLHCTHCVAISCLKHAKKDDLLPPITAYYAMRVGRLPLVPYFRPGDPALAAAVEVEAGRHRAVLLANHGPVVAGATLDDAVCNAEELEETAKLFLMLRGAATQFLTGAEVADIERHFPS